MDRQSPLYDFAACLLCLIVFVVGLWIIQTAWISFLEHMHPAFQARQEKELAEALDRFVEEASRGEVSLAPPEEPGTPCSPEEVRRLAHSLLWNMGIDPLTGRYFTEPEPEPKRLTLFASLAFSGLLGIGGLALWRRRQLRE